MMAIRSWSSTGISASVRSCQKLESALPTAGYRVAVASEQVAGPTAIETVGYNLVILEVTTVFTRNSRECQQQIGRLAWAVGTPMIARCDDGRLEYELLGAADYQPEPVDIERLVSMVNHFARQHGKPGQPEAGKESCENLQAYLTDLIGIYFSKRNRGLLVESLYAGMRALQDTSCSEYIDDLIGFGERRNELKKPVSLLTVGETHLFRYPARLTCSAMFCCRSR